MAVRSTYEVKAEPHMTMPHLLTTLGSHCKLCIDLLMCIMLHSNPWDMHDQGPLQVLLSTAIALSFTLSGLSMVYICVSVTHMYVYCISLFQLGNFPSQQKVSRDFKFTARTFPHYQGPPTKQVVSASVYNIQDTWQSDPY